MTDSDKSMSYDRMGRREKKDRKSRGYVFLPFIHLMDFNTINHFLLSSNTSIQHFISKALGYR